MSFFLNLSLALLAFVSNLIFLLFAFSEHTVSSCLWLEILSSLESTMLHHACKIRSFISTSRLDVGIIVSIYFVRTLVAGIKRIEIPNSRQGFAAANLFISVSASDASQQYRLREDEAD